MYKHHSAIRPNQTKTINQCIHIHICTYVCMYMEHAVEFNNFYTINEDKKKTLKEREKEREKAIYCS